MRLLITGVSGFIGYQTAVLAKKAGHEVIGVGRTPLSDKLKQIGVTEFLWDGWPAEMSSGPFELLIQNQGCFDAIIHIAGDAHYGNGPHYHDSNFRPTELLVKHALKFNPHCRFVFVSSVGAQDFPRFGSTQTHDEETLPCPRSDYGASKLSGERFIEASGLDYAIARLGMVFGRNMRPDSHVAVLLRATESSIVRRVVSKFRGILPLVHLDDAANALILLANHNVKAGTYLVVSENCSISKVVNSPRDRDWDTGTIGLGRIAGFVPAKLATTMSPVMKFDSSKIRALGWSPNTDTVKALKEVFLQIAGVQNGFHVVTGAASGLGRAFVEQLIQNGCFVVGVDIDPEAIDSLRLEYPQQKFICSDVTNPGLFDYILKTCEEANLPILSLYLIAGVGKKSKFIDLETHDIRIQFDTNVFARLILSKDYLQYLKHSNNFGRLVIVSSSTALQPMPDFSVYSATNAALLSFGRSLIAETSNDLCEILVLVPGGMDTNFQNSSGVSRLEKERLLDPSAVAQKIVKLSKRKSHVRVIGRNAKITQTISRLLPWAVADKLWARLIKIAR